MKLLTKTIIILFFAGVKAFSQTASFNVSKDKDCNILRVSIDGTASSGKAPLTYYWDFGNGNTTSGVDKAIVDAIYVQPGEPEISLFVMDRDGNRSDTVKKKVYILEGPKIDFGVNLSETCLGQTVKFENKTVKGSSDITGYIWNIGNNITLTDKDPSYTFRSIGNFDVTLVVKDANGCNVSLKKENLLKVSSSFQADFNSDLTSGCVLPFSTRFRDITNYGTLDTANFLYSWDFGDGSTSSERNPGKVYNAPGAFTVQLSITDQKTKCSSVKKADNYIVLENRKPVVNTSLQSKNCHQYTYKFLLNTAGLQTAITSEIDFGDGTKYTLKPNETEVTHTYGKPGKFLVRTSYNNSQNSACSQTSLDSIIIPLTGEDFTVSNQTGCKAPLVASFQTKNITDAVSYEWDFGDGTRSAEAAPVKTYTSIGNFTVRLKATAASGCTYTIEKQNFIKIGPLTASFITDAKRIETIPNEYNAHPVADPAGLYGGCVPFKVTFTNTSPPGDNLTYTWDFGDGTKINSSSGTVSHTYTSEGVFSPVLTAADNTGCLAVSTCKECVKAGTPPVADIVLSGPDTVCCLYEKNFEAKINPGDFDFLWYNIVLNDGGPSPGLTQAYYKNSQGQWVLEDNTTTLFPYDPEGLGLNFQQSSFSKPTGNQPDFFFYAYKNGCATRIEKPKFQHHLLPWGTFDALPCNGEENLQGGDVIDFNKVGGNWILGIDKSGNPMKLSKATVEFELISTTGCTMPKVSKTFTPAELGFDIDREAFNKIRDLNLFPSVKLPDCAGSGDVLMSTTYLFTDNDALKRYQNGKCLCEEHWPYKIGGKKKPAYSLSRNRGCAPLNVNFKVTNAPADFKFLFENGTVLQGSDVSYTFTKEGTYRFKTSSTTCGTGTWTDSIVVSSPAAKLLVNQNSFCLNSGTSNQENKTIELSTNSSSSAIKNWHWDFGNGKTINKSDSGRVSNTYSENDITTGTIKKLAVKLTVTDQNNCKSTDSAIVNLRKTNASFSVKRTTGCYDSLKILPAQGDTANGLKGTFTLSRLNGTTVNKIQETDLPSLKTKAILLDTNGKYQLKLTISGDKFGTCPSSFDTTIDVLYSSLTPRFKVKGKTTFSCIPSLVEVTDASTMFQGNEIKAWNWRIKNSKTGLEVTGEGETPDPFALTDSGYYSVTMWVEDEIGCKKSYSRDSVFFITDLKGTIDSLPAPLCPDEPGRFAGTSTNPENTFWDFGDGIVGSGLSVTHSYRSPGEKNISFIVTDSANCKRSYSGKVIVKKAPVFHLGPDTLLCEDKYIMYSAPKGPGYVYDWSTGDSASDLQVNKEGYYILTIRDTLIKCNYTDSVFVKISKLPAISTDPVPPICRSELIAVNGHTDSLANKVEWIKDNIIRGNTLTTGITAEGDPLVIFKVYNKDNCSISDSLRLTILERPQLILSSQSICPEDSIELKPELSISHPGFKWQWYFDSLKLENDTLSNLWISLPGNYTVTYGKPNCVATARATLDLHPLPNTGTNPEVVNFCEEFGTLSIDGGEAFSHVWQADNETQRFKTINKTGLYIVRLGTEHNCYRYDSILVETRCEPKLYVPTAFTPGIEGENQTHKIFGYNIGAFSLMIFSRWGELIYHSDNLQQPWNGTYRGELMPSGVYPWVIKYSGNNPDYSQQKEINGKVVLER